MVRYPHPAEAHGDVGGVGPDPNGGIERSQRGVERADHTCVRVDDPHGARADCNCIRPSWRFEILDGAEVGRIDLGQRPWRLSTTQTASKPVPIPDAVWPRSTLAVFLAVS